MSYITFKINPEISEQYQDSELTRLMEKAQFDIQQAILEALKNELKNWREQIKTAREKWGLSDKSIIDAILQEDLP